MADPRKERIAANEAMFREANERAHAWDEVQSEAEPHSYLCECADPDCRQRIRLTVGNYERARADSVHFVVSPGHQIADTEVVVDEGDGWMLVEKNPDVREIVEASDPRRG